MIIINYYLEAPFLNRAFRLMSKVFSNGSGDRVQFQRLEKWYLMPPCLTLNIIR